MKAEKLGYTNVKVFAEGYPAWMADKSNYASVSAEWVNSTDRQGRRHGSWWIPAPNVKKYDKGHISHGRQHS
jgi:3-mercaptopyruvate sulfurtransferase SseA